jgi:hypothetical protein
MINFAKDTSYNNLKSREPMLGSRDFIILYNSRLALLFSVLIIKYNYTLHLTLLRNLQMTLLSNPNLPKLYFLSQMQQLMHDR